MVHGLRIDPKAYYDMESICEMMKVKRSSLDKVRRSGELKTVKKLNRHVCLGQWIIEWLESDTTEQSEGRDDG